MGKVTHAAEHFSVEQIDQKIKQGTEPWRVRRWLVIRHALVDPQPAAEIGRHVGLAKQTVHNLISAYNRNGALAIETHGNRRKRCRAYLSLEEEKFVLDEVWQDSADASHTTRQQIHRAVEDRLGHSVDKSTICRLLARHRWRKVSPRPRHPKADTQQQEAFKKGGSPPRLNPSSNSEPPQTFVQS